MVNEHPSSEFPKYSHGTHMAGIIGANAYGSGHMIGVNWNTQIVAKNVADVVSNPWEQPNPVLDKVCDALQELAHSATGLPHNWVSTINMSFGGGCPYNDENRHLRSVLGYSYMMDQLCVASTGNESPPQRGRVRHIYPAAFSRGITEPGCSDGILAVGAFDSEDSVASYS